MRDLIAAGFILLTVVSYGYLLFKIRSRRLLIICVGWMVFLAAWSYSGIATRFELFPLNLAPVFVIPAVAIILFTIKGTHVIKDLSLKTLTSLQVFRVFVEILIWGSFTQDLLPIELTFEGTNWDIVSGITAPIAALLLTKSKWGLATWNFICLALLINVVSTAMIVRPQTVAIFPFILLPGMLVPLAYALSFFSLRKIFSLNLGDEETLTSASDRSVVHNN